MLENASFCSNHPLDFVVHLKRGEEFDLDMTMSLSSISSKGLTSPTMSNLELGDSNFVATENTLGRSQQTEVVGIKIDSEKRFLKLGLQQLSVTSLAVLPEINLHRIVLDNLIGNLILIFERSLPEPIIQLGLLVFE